MVTGCYSPALSSGGNADWRNVDSWFGRSAVKKCVLRVRRASRRGRTRREKVVRNSGFFIVERDRPLGFSVLRFVPAGRA